jgi:signal transduction histidine kinase
VFLLKRKVPPDQPQWHDDLRMLDRELENALEIIDNLTAMSRGKAPVKTKVDLKAIVASARERVDGPAEIEWHYACRPDPFLIRVDAPLLEQVFRNLFANSLHAIGGSGRISVESTRSEAFDEIVVADTGPGIPAELRDRIFEPLVTKRPGGVGLGLAICRQIVERHGGSIELLARDRPGAAFRIRLSIP